MKKIFFYTLTIFVLFFCFTCLKVFALETSSYKYDTNSSHLYSISQTWTQNQINSIISDIRTNRLNLGLASHYLISIDGIGVQPRPTTYVYVSVIQYNGNMQFSSIYQTASPTNKQFRLVPSGSISGNSGAIYKTGYRYNVSGDSFVYNSVVSSQYLYTTPYQINVGDTYDKLIHQFIASDIQQPDTKFVDFLNYTGWSYPPTSICNDLTQTCSPLSYNNGDYIDFSYFTYPNFDISVPNITYATVDMNNKYAVLFYPKDNTQTVSNITWSLKGKYHVENRSLPLSSLTEYLESTSILPSTTPTYSTATDVTINYSSIASNFYGRLFNGWGVVFYNACKPTLSSGESCNILYNSTYFNYITYATSGSTTTPITYIDKLNHSTTDTNNSIPNIIIEHDNITLSSTSFFTYISDFFSSNSSTVNFLFSLVVGIFNTIPIFFTFVVLILTFRFLKFLYIKFIYKNH